MSAGGTDLFGLPNCDSCRAARRWLEQHGVEYRFVDIRAQRLPAATLQDWLDAVGDTALVNRRSTTWRQLDEAQRAAVDSPERLIALLQEHPTLIKRPLLRHGDSIRVGFSADRFQEVFDGRD